MKNKWRNYALKDGKVQSSYIREYSSRSPKRKAHEASCRNSLLESRKEQEKEVKEYSCFQGHQFNANESTHSIMGGHACPYCPVNKYMRNENEREGKIKTKVEIDHGQESSGSKRKRRTRKGSGKSSSESGGI
jgi:hypothetical protein